MAYDQSIHVVEIPESLRGAGKASFEIIAEGVSFLHKDGIIILSNAIEVAHIDHLNSILTPEALEIADDPGHHFNFGQHTRNMDQAPPPTRDLFYKDIWANPFVSSILSAILGPRPVIHYANGNTALQAAPSGRQPVHSDIGDMVPVYFPFAYVVNISLVDVSPKNGATEVWPGSHHVSIPQCHVQDETEAFLPISPAAVEERRRHSPPVRACTKKGSIVIRDLRLWHAGMPNLTPTPRIMLAFVVQPAWFQGRSKVVLPLSVKDLVDSWTDEIQFAAEYVDGQVNYKKLSSDGVDFTSSSRVLKRFENDLCRWPDYAPRWY